MSGPSVPSLEGGGAHFHAGARHDVNLADAGVHAKEAEERDAVAASSSSAQHAAAAGAHPAATAAGAADYASDAVSSAIENGDVHVQSVHLSLKSHVEHLRQQVGLSDYDIAHVHHKSSAEQTRQNPEDPPAVWEPVAIEAAPRAPGFDDGEREGGNAKCESDNGKYGSLGKGGVILRYQYELTSPQTRSSGGLNEILPTLEADITDALLPVFFPEECGLGGSDSAEAAPVVGAVSGEKGEGEEGGGRQLRGHRRLTRVVGIDSDPQDFWLADKECTAEPTRSNSACHSMEGALTLHFPPHYNVLTLIQGAQLSALNAIREGMFEGSLAEVHEDILLLKFLDASYSLRPVMPQDATVQSDDGDGGGGKVGGMVAGILVPLLLLCCCAGLLRGWRRSGRTLDDLRSAALPRKKARSPLDLEEDEAGGSLHKPKSERKMKFPKRRSLSKRRGSEETDAEMDEGDPVARRLLEELTAADALLGRKKRTTARSAAEEGGASASEDRDADEGGAHRGSATTGSSSAAGDDLRSSTNSSGSECTTSTEGGSTTTSSRWSDSDGEGEGSATSSDDESMAEEDDRVNAGGFHELEQQVHQLQQVRSTFATQRREARRQRTAETEGRAPKPATPSNNLVMAGPHADDEMSVRTGVTGVHSLASQATEQVDNTRGDDASATAGTTGVRGRTRKASNAARDRSTGGARAYSGVLPSYSN